jgi:recombination protein RecA
MGETQDLAQEIKKTAEAVDFVDLPEVTNWCSSGCQVLDLAVSNRSPGGFPVGRIIQVYGGASTAKTVIATTAMGYALRSGNHAFLADVEHTFDPTFAKIYGLDCHHENFYYGYVKSKGESYKKGDQPTTVEELFDGWLGGILELPTRKPKFGVVDTLTVLPTAWEAEKSMDKQGYGATRPKQIGLGLRKYTHDLAHKGMTLFIIDQTRDDVGSPFGGETTTGGRGPEFYTSVRLYLKHDKKVTNSANKEIGIWVKFKVSKNKVAPPFRSGKFKILFDYGMDDIVSSLSFLAENDTGIEESYKMTCQVKIPVCDKCGAIQTIEGPCSCGGTAKFVSKRMMEWVGWIEEHNQEINLRKYVAKVWEEVYRMEPRKQRVF